MDRFREILNKDEELRDIIEEIASWEGVGLGGRVIIREELWEKFREILWERYRFEFPVKT